AVVRADPRLSRPAVALGSRCVPVHAQLLGLCAGIASPTRSRQGPVAGCKAAGALPSHHLARRFVGLRSRSSFKAAPSSMTNNKNVLLAIALAAAVLFLWQYFVATPSMKAEQGRQAALTHQEKAKPQTAPVLPGIAAGGSHMSREAALKVGGQRVVIDTPMVDG